MAKKVDPASINRMRDLFAWIEMNAKAAKDNELSTMDALCYIMRDWKLIEHEMLTCKMVDD